MEWIKYNQFNYIDKNPKFITASQTLVALAYMRSIFARISLNVSFAFKLIQDKCRDNESEIQYRGKYPSIKPFHAGPRFLYDLQEQGQETGWHDWQQLHGKIQQSIYCGVVPPQDAKRLFD